MLMYSNTEFHLENWFIQKINPTDVGDPLTFFYSIIGWIVVTFGTFIHGAQRMNPSDFDDPHQVKV